MDVSCLLLEIPNFLMKRSKPPGYLLNFNREMYVNEAFILKSCVVFHMLTSLINFDNAKRLIKLLVDPVSMMLFYKLKG